MSVDKIAIDDLCQHLIERTLQSPITPDVFHRGCDRLLTAGVSILRVNMAWGTLHPTVGALSLRWWRDSNEDEIIQYMHDDGESDEWLKSPGYYAIKNKIAELDIRIDNTEERAQFDVLDDFYQAGGTHYILKVIPFSNPSIYAGELDGVLLSFLTDREGGFSKDERDAINSISKYMALTLKVALRERIALNTLTAYLGDYAAARVLSGAIRLGDGENINAVIWYSDLRNSTDLGDRLAGPELLNTLNSYFACTAGVLREYGGEVLRFVGDAVLAIFPYEEGGLEEACENASKAAKASVNCLKAVNEEREKTGDTPLAFGLGLHVGDVMFGNIGIPERLDFSVTGPAANEVARIETMTKELNCSILASRAFAQHQPKRWKSLGIHPLRGVERPIELFTLK